MQNSHRPSRGMAAKPSVAICSNTARAASRWPTSRWTSANPGRQAEAAVRSWRNADTTGPQFGEAPLFATQGEDQHAQLIFMHSDAVAPQQRHRLQNQTFRLGQLTSHQCQHDAIEQVCNCVGRLPETRFKAYQGVELGLDQPDIAALHE